MIHDEPSNGILLVGQEKLSEASIDACAVVMHVTVRLISGSGSYCSPNTTEFMRRGWSLDV
jgi:hypothetical protein